MKDEIKQLNYGTDEATKVILEHLVERKKEFDYYRNIHIFTLLLNATISCFAIYKFSLNFYEFYNGLLPLSQLKILPLFVLISCLFILKLLKKKVDQCELDYDSLRIEVIDKAPDLWNDEKSWENRHHIFKFMEDKYGINLYYENK